MQKWKFDGVFVEEVIKGLLYTLSSGLFQPAYKADYLNRHKRRSILACISDSVFEPAKVAMYLILHKWRSI